MPLQSRREIMKTIAKFIFLALVPAVIPAALAQHRTFAVNPDASQVAFTLAGTGHHVNGTFHVQSGSVDFDRAAKTISGSVIVAAGSGNSGEPSRDKKMNSDVLDAAHFADVSFAPKSYQGTIAPGGDSSIEVTGVFTLHGTPHDLTVPMQIHIDGTSLTAKTQFKVPYVQWGLKDPSIFILKVAKEVDIDLTLVGSMSPSN
jgi:polyisoprenoid-binding protein YceI